MIPRMFRIFVTTSNRRLSGVFFRRNVTTSSNNENFREVEIPVPWGKLAGKLWNPESKTQPILAVHGWQDNAGSFDNLIPLLPKNMSYLAIDMPGHGNSSWIPEGMMYTKIMYVQTIDRVRRHFGWDKFGLVGHSFGGMFSFTYSALFPGNVKFVVALDYFKYLVENISVRTSKAAQDLDEFMKMEKYKRPPRAYTYKEIVEKMVRASDGVLDEESYTALMKRGLTKKDEDRFCLNRDPRVRLIELTAAFTEEHLREKAERIRCPYVVLKAESSGYGERKCTYTEILKALERSSADFQFFTVPGKHYFHMTNAPQIAKCIVPFLEKHN